MIVRERMTDELVTCNGIAFIGDPHITSRRPGRRTDSNYGATILGKVEFCLDHATENNLFPVFLGDFYDAPVIDDETIKTRVTRLLRRSKYCPIENHGNHTNANARLSDGDSLMTLASADLLDVVVETTPIYEFMLGDMRVGLGATPYGQAIPTDVRGAFPEADLTIWLTHHDIAFDETYPGAVPPHEIQGCDLVVNGHIHQTKAPLVVGQTTWFNVGNITRQSLDVAEHVPTLWVLGTTGAFEAIEIPHAKDVFDFTGRLVKTASGKEVIRTESEGSAFVELMRRETSLDLDKSDDGSLVKEEIDRLIEEQKTPQAVQAIVMSLLAEAIAARHGTD